MATIPGRSGKATPYAPLAPSMSAGYLAIVTYTSQPAFLAMERATPGETVRCRGTTMDASHSRMAVDVVTRSVSLQIPALPLQPPRDSPNRCFHCVQFISTFSCC